MQHRRATAAAGYVRLTTAEALVRYLVAQRIVHRRPARRARRPLFPGVLAIFGHGNATSLGHSLERHRDELPVWRGQNEQGMGLAAAAFAKAMRRAARSWSRPRRSAPARRTWSPPPASRCRTGCPCSSSAGDTFVSRLPDPVLQQVEHFGAPSITVNDAFRAGRAVLGPDHPPRAAARVPAAGRRDPARPGGLRARLHRPAAGRRRRRVRLPGRLLRRAGARDRPPAARRRPGRAAAARGAARGPASGDRRRRGRALLARRGRARGLRRAVPASRSSRRSPASRACSPTTPATPARSGSPARTPPTPSLPRPTSCSRSGTRLEDFTTGSWTVFAPTRRSSASTPPASTPSSTSRCRSSGTPARRSTSTRTPRSTAGPPTRTGPGRAGRRRSRDLDRSSTARTAPTAPWPPSYAQVVGRCTTSATADDYVLTAAGGLPGRAQHQLAQPVRSRPSTASTASRAWATRSPVVGGRRSPATAGEVFSLVGDGSYLMLNSEIYSSVPSGHAVRARRLRQRGLRRHRPAAGRPGRGVLQQHARRPRGSRCGRPGRLRRARRRSRRGRYRGGTLDELEAALGTARAADRTCVVVTTVRADDWTPASRSGRSVSPR